MIGESKKKVRPCFALLEGRYGGVSQERGRYLIGARMSMHAGGVCAGEKGLHGECLAKHA